MRLLFIINTGQDHTWKHEFVKLLNHGRVVKTVSVTSEAFTDFVDNFPNGIEGSKKSDFVK